METISGHPLLPVTQEDMVLVRKSYDLDVKRINENVDVIEEWLKKQDHLVEALPYLKRDMLERFNILGRGSVEQTKNIIERVLTVRGMLPDLTPSKPDVLVNELDNFLENLSVTSLCKANPSDNSRVFIYRLRNDNFEDIDMLTFLKLGCFILEVRLHHDYIFTDRLIIDLKNVKASILTKLNPVVLRKSEVMFTDAYKIRTKGFHLVNAPSFVNKFLSILKQIFNEKISSRIHIHSSYEELYQEIPREILPKEYGGDQMSCEEITEQWRDYLKTEDAKRIIENASNIISNETKRSDVRFNEEYLGMPGSFKQLKVD